MVSIIMSTYNEDIKDIQKSVESILKQSYEEFEFIIVLDNPHNKVIEEYLYSAQLSDERIRIVKNEKNIGLANSLNKALAIANGIYIARMDADDISMNDRIEKQVNYLDVHQNCHVVASDRTDIDEQDNDLPTRHILIDSKKVLYKALLCSNVLTHPSVMIRKDFLDEVGGYRNFKAGQDYDLWLRMIKKKANFHIIPEKLIKYRIRQKGITKSNVANQHGYSLYAQYLFHVESDGEDMFSEEHMNRYLKHKNMVSKAEKNKYNEAYELMFEGIKKIKSEGFRAGIGMVIQAILTHRLIFAYTIKSLKKDYIIRKYTYIDIN